MDEEFESFVVDPNLTDPELDISGLRTATDTRPELLFDLPEFSGIRVDPTRGSYIEDMYRAYSGQIPMLDVETPAAAPPATGGGGSGDGGQATAPTDDFNKQEFEQNLIDEGVGLQIAPGQPVVAPGEMPVTNLEMAIYNDPNLGVVDVDGEGEFGGLIDGVDPDRIQANEFVGIETPTGIGPTYDEAGLNLGIPDRGMGQIPVDTRVTEDFTRPTMADIAGIETPTGIGPTYDEAGLPDTSIPDRNRGQIPTSTDEFDVTTDQFTRPTMADIAGPGDFTGAPIQTEDLQTIDGEPIGYLGTLDTPPNIVMAKDPEGVVNPFDGKYTMSTAITPEDTEQSITNKIADFLDVDASKINKAAVTGALNLVAGKVLDTAIPIATVFDLVKDAFVKSPEQEAAEEQARQDRIEEAAAITRRIEEEDRQRRETEAREAAAARAREEAAQRAREEAARAAAIARQQQQNQGGGGRDRDPTPSAPARTSQGVTSAQFSAFRR